MHDVHLVDRRESAASRGSDLEAAPRDALHLGPRVLTRVVPGAVLPRAALAEVETADELSHDHDVDPLAAGGPQVRVDAELLAQAEQALLRPHRLSLELGEADCREEDRVGRLARAERLVRERRPPSEDRVPAERVLRVGDPEGVEHADRLGGDLGADPVAGEDDDVRHRSPACDRSSPRSGRAPGPEPNL